MVLENFRPGVADRLGIGYAQLSADNPGLVYVSVSGFGPDGPYADQPVYDLMIQGMSGLMPIQGGDGEPQMLKSVIADKNAAITAASAALAALLARERNGGQGQHVHVPMLNAYAQLAMPDNMTVESFRPKPEIEGAIPDMYRVWQCADGHMVGMMILDKQYQGLCRALSREDLANDERFVGTAICFRPVLDQPAAFQSQRGQTCLGVDGDRESHGVEEGKVGRRVGVGDRFGEVEMVFGGVVTQCLGADLAGGGDCQQLAGVAAVAHRHLGADHVVEERPKRVDDNVQGSGDEQGAMPQAAVFPNPAEGSGKCLGEDVVGQ